jgi:hypothetical protein
MPHPNSARYPIVAVPQDVFDVMLRALSNVHDYGKIASVNQVVQYCLNHSPMYDYLLVGATVVKDAQGQAKVTYENHFYGDQCAVKQVRVTKSQYEMLRIRQAQYASDGYRVPISCIVTAMLAQWCHEVREFVRLKLSNNRTAVAVQISDDDVEAVRFLFFKDYSSSNTYHYTSEESLPSPSVIPGWNPEHVPE